MDEVAAWPNGMPATFVAGEEMHSGVIAGHDPVAGVVLILSPIGAARVHETRMFPDPKIAMDEATDTGACPVCREAGKDEEGGSYFCPIATCYAGRVSTTDCVGEELAELSPTQQSAVDLYLDWLGMGLAAPQPQQEVA